MLPFRGLHGLPLIPYHPCEEQSAVPRQTTQDYIILNSVSNLSKAEGLLAEYSRIGCFLDNDTAGRTACEHLKARFGERLFDKSIHYRGYKDLNDYLCGKSLSQSVEPMKQKQ